MFSSIDHTPLTIFFLTIGQAALFSTK